MLQSQKNRRTLGILSKLRAQGVPARPEVLEEEVAALDLGPEAGGEEGEAVEPVNALDSLFSEVLPEKKPPSKKKRK